ncbi:MULTISPECIES: GNAT family N-acetyltransferase [unclassified Streptomyces]|uniref:GNAT family N-acetyltransferase n=1 Tax=unclassified Streptomyces TaxID=2593676 RepID=UPI0037A2487B
MTHVQQGETASPKRDVTVHEEVIDGFGTVRMRVVDPAADAEVLHSWVTQEHARYWGMLGADQERVRDIYGYVDSLATHHAYLVHLDDRPVALFQTYEPEHDPVGECYEVQPGDFGVHVLIGPPVGPAAPGFTGTLLGFFLGHLLEDRSRTRIVAEPDSRNDRAIARFLRTGFVKGPEIELPEKRARLVFLDRADFRRN